MSRSSRGGFDVPTRLSLLESDADATDAHFDKLLESVDRQLELFRKGQARNSAYLIGVLVSLATAAMLLAVNIGFVR
jgi:hypothetical protein